MPIYRLDQFGVWKKLKVYRLNSTGVWKKLVGYRLDQFGVWKRIFGLDQPIIETKVEISRSGQYHNSSNPVTLTGKKYHFSGANSFSYRFFSSATGNAPWTPITTTISTSNPSSGSSSNVTYQLQDVDFTSATMYFKFSYTGTNTTSGLSTTSESDPITVTFLAVPAPPPGFPNINQSTITVASTASSGAWTGSPTLYQWIWQYGPSNNTLTYEAIKNISSISLSGTTATVTIFNHGFKNGDTITFAGINSLFNQLSTTIFNPFTNFFSYTVSKPAHSFGTNYSVGQFVTFGGQIYQSLVATPTPRSNWSSSTTYTTGQYVNSGSQLWQATGTSLNQTPFSGSDFWNLIDIYPTSTTYWQSQNGSTTSGGTATGPNYHEGSSSSPISYTISSFPSTDYKTGTSLQGLTTRMNVVVSNAAFTSPAYNSASRTIFGYPLIVLGSHSVTSNSASIIYSEANMDVYDIDVKIGPAYTTSASGFPKTNQANSSPISITGLTGGTDYIAYITPKNADSPRVSGIQRTRSFTTSSPPINTAAPTIGPMNGRTATSGYAGYLPVSTQLTANVGSWSNVTGSTTYSYEWFKEDSITGVPTLAGTASQITFSTSDVDDTVFVKVTATNSDGSSTVATSGTYILSQAVAVGTITPTSANQNVSTTFSFNISHFPTSYVINWGDGTSDSYSVTANTSTVNASHAHTYTSSGPFVITVTAQPGNKQNTATVNVAAPLSFTFDANGGTLSSGPGNGLTTYTYTGSVGSTLTAPSAIRQHYTFSTWRSPLSGSVPSPEFLTPGINYTFGTGELSTPRTFFAIWNANSYTVTYNANGGTVSPNSQTVSYPNSVTLPTPSRTGYTFNGWYDSASAGTFIGNAGASYTPTSNITLFAQWTAITYTITWSTASNNGLPGGVTVSVSPTSSSGIFGGTVTAPTPTASSPHYTFLYWRDTISAATYLYQVSGGGTWTINGSLTFFSWWQARTYTVSYNYNGGTGTTTSNSATFPNSVTLPTPDARAGFTFNGWYTASSGGTFIGNAGASYAPTSNITLFAQWTAIIYTITWNPNGGSVSPTSSTGTWGQSISSPTPTRTNHTFLYWRDGTTVFNYVYQINPGGSWTIGTGNTGNITFHAWWQIIQYTVTFNYNGGSGSPASSTVDAGNSVTLPSPTRSGFTFNGWYTAASGGSFIGNAGSLYTPTSNITIFAQWTVQQFTVTWDANGGTVSPTSNTVTAGTSVTAPTPTRSGFTFSTWRNPLSGGDPILLAAGQSYTVNGNITFFAIWTQQVPGPPRTVSLTRNQTSWNGTSWTWNCTWLAPNTGGSVSTYEAYREVGTGTVGNATLSTITNTSTPQTGLTTTSTTFSTTVQAAPRADAYVRACNSGGCSSYVSGNVG